MLLMGWLVMISIAIKHFDRDTLGENDLTSFVRHGNSSILNGPFHQTNNGGFHLQPTVLCTINPEINPQIDSSGPQAVHEYQMFWLIENCGVRLQHLAHCFLGEGDRIFISNANAEINAAVGITGVIMNDALINRRIGNLDIIARKSHKNSGTRGHALDKAEDIINFDQITGIKGLLHAEKNTREEIFGNIAEGNAQNKAE